MSDSARMAAVAAALLRVRSGTTIGLGSGRAVFALIEALSEAHVDAKVVVASSETANRSTRAGLEVLNVDDVSGLDLTIDGADEVDSDLALIKGGGAALLREKLVASMANEVVIIAEAPKLVARLGESRTLPIEVVRFAWQTTAARLEALGYQPLRRVENDKAVVTNEGHYLLDVKLLNSDIGEQAQSIKATLGVVEHGLFLTEASSVILGHDDGTTTLLER